MTADEERMTGAQKCLSGFPSLSHFIARDNDHSTAVHRTFDRLAARDLLYYEAELLELEAQQDQFDEEDAAEANKATSSSLEWLQIRQNARDWSSFRRSATDPSATGLRWKKRMDLAMQIRATLKEYRKALAANAEVLSLSRPSKQTMTALSNTFHQKIPGSLSSDDFPEIDPIMLGNGARLFPLLTPGSPMPATDHVSLNHIPEPDLLTYFLKEYTAQSDPLSCRYQPIH